MRKLTGDEALAYGALHSGVSLVTSYPGSPSSGVVEILTGLIDMDSIYIEWSANEKVAAEMAIGASVLGRRALVCVKSVGMNAMVDPLMALNLTPVAGGLVIVLGDDPGGYASQNDQDTRPLCRMLEIPLLEPSEPGDAYSMVIEAFEISEQTGSPVIIRETRSFSQSTGDVDLRDFSAAERERSYTREVLRYVPVPKNAVQKHKELHLRLAKLERLAEESGFNQIQGNGRMGIIACGLAWKKLVETTKSELPRDFSVFKLGNIFPLPRKKIAGFLEVCDQLMVLEENEPFVEEMIKVIAFENKSGVEIHGKNDGFVHREGELFRWQIAKSLERFLPPVAVDLSYKEENEVSEYPHKEANCRNCGYDRIIDVIEEASATTGVQVILNGDPGCLVTVAERIDTKFAMGSAVGVADGMEKSGCKERVIAVFGDSSFFHTTIPAICNAVVNDSRILMIVLDNGNSMASGGQPHPGSGTNIQGKKTQALSIEGIARSIGVNLIDRVKFDKGGVALGNKLKSLLPKKELSLLIIEI